MRVKVVFGLIDTKEVLWFQDVLDFPKLINFCGKNFEWVFYDKDPLNKVDYIFTFAQLMMYDPNYSSRCSSWEDLFPEGFGDCVCGSKYDRHSPNAHLTFCHMWRKN